ncbi:MAG: hypothetical protein A3G18_00730 [Rhodospirillales bacterium RIFCSPLOWO2_12_FULL_58_28]|nr:MAG: hypothetical protein A3H92_01840 [Rhodospirillales bacterium RIFCSPLOWO2_02_FULL_58_16]OHC79506.1 MAG: hypothetical protein A3G18_00730 [Rhodospirillales bacterium RIFCSPLOWO2_12_FULL_58_28]
MGNEDLEKRIVFPAGLTGNSGAADAHADAWKLLRLLAASESCSLDNMRLIRWERLRASPDKRRDADDAAMTLRAGIEELLSPQSECIRYDDFSFLVVCRDGSDIGLFNSVNGLVDTLGARISGHAGPIRVFRPSSVEEEGFGFIRVHDEIPAAAPPPASRMVLADPEFRYYPLWDVRGNDVFCYLCEPLWDVGGGEFLSEDSLPGLFTDPLRILALDLEALRKAVAQIEDAISRYGVMQILAPVHFQTLADAGNGKSYINLCKKLVWSVLDYVFFEIVKPPALLDRTAVEEAVSLVKPYGGGVMLRVEPGFDGFDMVPADAVLSLGMDFRGGGRDEREVMAELKRFAGKASECGVRSHAHGLETITLSAAAVSAGFDYVGSEDLAQALDSRQPEDDKSKPIGMLKTLLKTRQT